MKNQPIDKEITLVSQITQKSSQTLLEFLAGKFKYLTPAEWEERVTSGKVKVNDIQASSGQPLRAGDEVAYTTNSWEEPEVNPHYRVVFEDEALLAVSKPAPLPVHAIGAYFRNTLMQLLRRDRPEARNYHLVHRLDSETSGLLLLVKDAKYLKGLQKQWSGKNVQKTYQAIVFGRFQTEKLKVDAPIGKKVGSPIRMKLAVVPQSPPLEKGGMGVISDSKPSVTEFKLLERKGNFSRLEVRPLTGRTHQIRVHLEHLGFPIVGDKIYSGNDETFLHFYDNDWDEWLKERVLLPRLALHAYRLEFPHPVSGEQVVLEDPLAEDLRIFWENLPQV